MSDHSQVAHPAVSGGADLDAALPATAAQREVWVAQNVDPSSPVYNIGLVVEVDGTIDIERAAAAIEASVGRVEALFVHFEVDADNQLIQVPIPDARWDVEILDLRAEADPDSTAQSWMDTDMARVFGPDDLLFRQVLLLTADDRVIWYQRYHHSVVDGYGISLIVADVAERYDDPNLGTAAPQWSLDAVVAADLDYRNSPRFQTDRQYWVERVESGPEATRILHGQVMIRCRRSRRYSRSTLIARHSSTAMRPTRDSTNSPAHGGADRVHRTNHRKARRCRLGTDGRSGGGRNMRRTPSMASTILPLSIRVERSETIGQLATRLDTALVSILKHGRYRGEDLARDIRAIDPDRQVFGPGINSMMFEHTLTFGGCPVRVRNSVTGRVSDLDLSVRGGQDGGEPIEIDVRAPAGFDRELADHTARIEQFLDRFVAEPQLPISALDPHVARGERTRAPRVERHRRAAARHDGAGFVAQQLLCRSERCRRGRRGGRPADVRRTRKSGITARRALDLSRCRDRNRCGDRASEIRRDGGGGCWPSCVPVVPSCHWIRHGLPNAANRYLPTRAPHWCSPRTV